MQNMPFIYQYVFWFFFSFLFTLILGPLCIRLAYFLNIVDYPDGKLKNHKKPTPYLGGLSLFLPLILCVIFYAPYLVAGLTVLFTVGFIDDLKRLSPKLLILGHSLGALCFLLAGCIVPITNYAFFNFFISFFWLISIINAFNLIDVMDGVASVASLSAGIAFFATAIISESFMIILPIVALCGSLLAFIVFFNRPPARIYLGDAGSLLLGGFFGSFSLIYFDPTQESAISFFIRPIFLLLIPISEIVGLIIIRSYKGIPFYKGSPDHFSHYLKKGGWSNFSILFFIFLASIVGFILQQVLFFDKALTIEVFQLVALLVATWSAYVANLM